MSKWVKQSGVSVYTPIIQQYVHERTRKWYIRLERATAGDPLTVKVYAVLADASAGNANNSGVATVPVTSRQLKATLSAGPQAPSLAGAVLFIQIEVVDLATATGTAVWELDLGKMQERAQLWVLRAFSKISTANGYFTNFARVERGIRTFEDAKQRGLLPYLGVTNTRTVSTDNVIGGAQSGTLKTNLYLRCLAYDNTVVGPEDTMDSDTSFMQHDLRRALVAAFTADSAYGGLVNDGASVTRYEFAAGEPDLGVIWARESGLLDFEVILEVIEPGQSEVATG